MREPRSRFSVNWMWLVHAVLLTLSFGLFVSAYFTRVSTLTHVQHFSAYCELEFLNIESPFSDCNDSSCCESRRIPDRKI